MSEKLIPKFLKGTGTWSTRLFNKKQRNNQNNYNDVLNTHLVNKFYELRKRDGLDVSFLLGDDGKISLDKATNYFKNDVEGKQYYKDLKNTYENEVKNKWDINWDLNSLNKLSNTGTRLYGKDFANTVNFDFSNPIDNTNTENTSTTTTTVSPSLKLINKPFRNTFSTNLFANTSLINPFTGENFEVPIYKGKHQDVYDWYASGENGDIDTFNNYMRKIDSNHQDIKDWNELTDDHFITISNYQYNNKLLSKDGYGKLGKYTLAMLDGKVS